MKQRELSRWLKLIIVCALFGLLFCIYAGPQTCKKVLLDTEELQALYKPFIWISRIPFFIELALGWKICTDIGSNQDFTVANADRLKIISVLAVIEGVLYVAAVLYIFSVCSYHTNVLDFIFIIDISVFTLMLS